MDDPMLPLDSARLVLRRFADGDALAFAAYRNDPEVARYQSWTGCSAAEAAAFVHEQHSQELVPGEWLQIAVTLRQTDALIGDCALKIHESDPRQATIGFTFARQFQQRGFATEAVSCLLDYLFRRRRLHRVIADTDALNSPASRLMERIGMRREGHLRRSLWFKGGWADEYLYAILADEWLARRAAAP